MYENFSKQERQKTRPAPFVFFVLTIGCPVIQPMEEKKTKVDYRPIPEFDKSLSPLPRVLSNPRTSRRSFKVPGHGEFYRSRSKRRVQPQEVLSETEDEVTEDW